MIDVTGIPKPVLLKELYKTAFKAPAARAFGTLGPDELTLKEAEDIIKKAGANLYFDYCQGHGIKTNLSPDSISPRLYDRDAGDGAFAAAVERARKSLTRSFHYPSKD